MNALRCLALDPGPVRTGVACVEVRAGALWVVLGSHRELDLRREEHRAWLRAQFQEVRALGGIVAVETVTGYAYDASRVSALCETTRVEGMILALAYEHGLVPLEIPAGDGSAPVKAPDAPLPAQAEAARRRIEGWRAELCHTPQASDEQIAIVVEGLVGYEGAPIRARERPHVYDAAGLAIVAIHRHLGRRVRLPAAVETALYRQQQAERAERAAKRASGAGKAKSPRLRTRAQRQRAKDGKVLAAAARRP